MANSVSKTNTAGPSREDVRRICGDIVDWKVDAIIATGAGFEELEEAVAGRPDRTMRWARRGNRSSGWLQRSTISSPKMTNSAKKIARRHSRSSRIPWWNSALTSCGRLRRSPGCTSMVPRKA